MEFLGKRTLSTLIRKLYLESVALRRVTEERLNRL